MTSLYPLNKKTNLARFTGVMVSAHSSVLYSRAMFLLFCVFCTSFATSQTIVNAYAKVTGISTSGGVSVLSLSNVNQANHTFAVGGVIIIMQMQDNVIGTNTTNANSFGNLSGIANAGRYESAAIAAMSGAPNSITLTTLLSNAYNINANTSVQIITLRNLGAYTTTANISGLAWDGNVGGVLAIQATTLTLRHRILMDERGFRGGVRSNNADQTCDNSFYTGNDANKGFKGEGIYKVTSSTYNNGRGKIINGGGGGSQNNTGGGGGGNYTAGGNGGRGWGCSDGNSGRGIGGIALSGQISASRIFMGGGGGGGQQNNSVGTNGGNGGGIILIKANTIRTDNTCVSTIRISANGQDAASSGNDGAGGGGAGGSIVIDAVFYSFSGSCPITVQANGGNGGDVGNSGAHGGGGGGGQGVVIYSTAQPTLNATTQTNYGNVGTDNDNGTTTGSNGGGPNGGGILAPLVTPLPVKLIRFDATTHLNTVELWWATASEKNNDYFTIEKSADGIEFSELSKISGAGNSQRTLNYTYVDINPYEGISYYRLKQTDYDGKFEYSKIVSANFEMQNVSVLVFPNPVSQSLNLVFDGKDIGKKTKTISVQNMYGKTLLEFETQDNSTTVDFSAFSSGVYMIKTLTGGIVTIKKVVKE
ncbi:MAG: T9SS type A sorting domain-containing protein [Bacteroidetes bacterium]|nr:T9SS type A sorting domain-containing protein [Bacteroidota bacterium]